MLSWLKIKLLLQLCYTFIYLSFKACYPRQPISYPPPPPPPQCPPLPIWSIGITNLAAFCILAFVYYAICLAILLRHKLHAKLPGISCLAINKSRKIFVATTIARSRIRFYFLQRSRQRCNAFLKHCTV